MRHQIIPVATGRQEIVDPLYQHPSHKPASLSEVVEATATAAKEVPSSGRTSRDNRDIWSSIDLGPHRALGFMLDIGEYPLQATCHGEQAYRRVK